ncbi:hypothetical protein M5D96_005050 [Drosophila gunungcola]|uniref:Uncharacterized protein n=1 Tax=Drosophila gunungcola TaxID=103775 RepID=A0A9Q0BT30_9MUSC|nr:hypothetical protein M5D96_005050 [Drosophila gunungcola]
MMSASRCADVCRYLTLYCVHIINFQIIVKYSERVMSKLLKNAKRRKQKPATFQPTPTPTLDASKSTGV